MHDTKFLPGDPVITTGEIKRRFRIKAVMPSGDSAIYAGPDGWFAEEALEYDLEPDMKKAVEDQETLVHTALTAMRTLADIRARVPGDALPPSVRKDLDRALQRTAKVALLMMEPVL